MTDYNARVRGADRIPPTPGQPGENVPQRGDRLGSLFTRPYTDWRQAAAMDGTYFVGHNPTNDAATTLAGHAAPLLADADVTLTKPLLFFRMPDASTKQAVLDFIEIEVVTAGATATQACWAAQIDSGATRVTTAGTDFTRVNPNQRSANVPELAVSGGAIVVGAETAAVRHLGHGTLRPSIEIAGDRKIFVFGGDPIALGGMSDTAAAAVRSTIVVLPAVILGATDCFLLALHGQAAQNAAGIYKVRCGWREEV